MLMHVQHTHCWIYYQKEANKISCNLIHPSLSVVGLIFLLQDPELSTTLIHALRGGHRGNKEDCIPLRYASVLISKGFFCSPLEIGMIVGMHLKVVSYFLKNNILPPLLLSPSSFCCLFLFSFFFIQF